MDQARSSVLSNDNRHHYFKPEIERERDELGHVIQNATTHFDTWQLHKLKGKAELENREKAI